MTHHADASLFAPCKRPTRVLLCEDDERCGLLATDTKSMQEADMHAAA